MLRDVKTVCIGPTEIWLFSLGTYCLGAIKFYKLITYVSVWTVVLLLKVKLRRVRSLNKVQETVCPYE